jgi:hypothetical protein
MFCFSKTFICLLFVLFHFFASAQKQISNVSLQNNFWKNVQFGGGFGLSIGNRFTDISLAPSAIYNVNQYYAAGIGLQYSYISSENTFKSNNYGVSLLQLFNPIDVIQFSAELEQLRVNLTYNNTLNNTVTENFWNTALFVGGGYRQEGLTVGVRYNVLFNKQDRVYSEAFMPFVRIFF